MPQAQPRRPDGSALEAYLREINETPLLGAEEERELAWRVEGGDAEARDHMVRANLRLVVSIARRYTGHGLCLEDLIAEGNMGLLRAAEGFDPSMNTRFSTYASYWVRQSIKRAVFNTAKAIRVPAYMAELLVKWRQAAARLQEELGRVPTPEEVAHRLDLPVKKLKIIQEALRVCHATSRAEADGSASLLEELVQDDGDSPDAPLMGAENLHQAAGLLAGLGSREAAVLRMRFGLDGDGPRTLKEIGERLGVTRERVRQIEGEALRALRQRLGAG